MHRFGAEVKPRVVSGAGLGEGGWGGDSGRSQGTETEEKGGHSVQEAAGATGAVCAEGQDLNCGLDRVSWQHAPGELRG